MHFAGPLDERLPRGVGRRLTLAALRFVNGDFTLFDNDDRTAGMHVPAGQSSRLDCDLRDDDVGSFLERNGPG